jgi:hypothetical protein
MAAQQRRRRLRLRQAVGVQRDIDGALRQIARVPIRLAMAEKEERARQQRAQCSPSRCIARCTDGRASMR